MTTSPSNLVSSRRGLLAFVWFIVNVLSLVAFAVALIFGLSSKNVEDEEYYQNYYKNEGNSGDKDNEELDPELAVTSRAIAFAAMWTAVLAVLLSIFGTVILGWQSPTGQYYTCCSSRVHRTTPITLGGFIGALLMFANLALVCAALFGEFEVRFQKRLLDRSLAEGCIKIKSRVPISDQSDTILLSVIVCLCRFEITVMVNMTATEMEKITTINQNIPILRSVVPLLLSPFYVFSWPDSTVLLPPWCLHQATGCWMNWLPMKWKTFRKT